MRPHRLLLLVAFLGAACGSPGSDGSGGTSAGGASGGSAGHGGASVGGGGADACAAHCDDGRLDCGEVGFDCGGDCAPCAAFDVGNVCGPATEMPWKNPHVVAVLNPDGSTYESSLEEPEVRTLGGATWLFFNDDGEPSGDKDLRYARWDPAKSAFVVLGTLPGDGVMTPAVDGNPTLDRDGHFYFVSTRAYPNPTETIYGATFSVTGPPAQATGTLSDVHRLAGLSRPDAPWATQGVEVTWDGSFLFFDEAKFDVSPPSVADIVAAKRSGDGYARLSPTELDALLGRVNTAAFLEYAETLSRDGLEIYFTRTSFDPQAPEATVMCLMRATRLSVDEGFGFALDVAATEPMPGVLMEAPSLSPDEKTLYYHRRSPSDSTVRLYAVER